MKPYTHVFSRTTVLMLMSLLWLSLSLNQFAQAAPVACTYIIEGGTSTTLSGNDQSLAITVKASQSSCTWTAKSNNPTWIHITNGGNYTGTAQVNVTVDFNATPNDRIGTINMAGDIYTIIQRDKCFFHFPDRLTGIFVGKAGGDIQVRAASNCPATVLPKASWIKFNGPTNHPAFTGWITFTIAPNNGAARTGKVDIADFDISFHQEGTCTYNVSPTSQNVPVTGGTYSIHSLAQPACNWAIPNKSDSTWVKITNTSGGSLEDRVVEYTVSTNNGAARTAKLTIGDKQVTISQAAAQPAPQLLYVNPGFVTAGSPSTTVTLTGNNFTVNSQVRWNGISRPAVYVSPTQLNVTLTDLDLKTAANHKVTVFDGGAGQASNEQPFLVLSPQASVSAASYKGEEIAPDSIVAAFGTKLADSTAVAKTVPLPISLAGTMVRVRDSKDIERLAPLFFVSANQVNYLVPPETAPGKATIIIISASVNISLGYVNIVKVAPGVFTAAGNGVGHPSAQVLRVKANGQQVYEPIAGFDQATQKFVGLPIDLTVPGEQVFLVLYGTGLRNRSGLNGVNLTIGGIPVTTAYAGPSSLTGLDQLNAPLPTSLAGRGEVNLVLSADGKTANTVKLTFK